MVLLTAGVLGVGAWGIEAGIHETKGTVGEFFGIVTGFQVQASLVVQQQQQCFALLQARLTDALCVQLNNISSQATVLESEGRQIGVSLQSTLTALQSSASAPLPVCRVWAAVCRHAGRPHNLYWQTSWSCSCPSHSSVSGHLSRLVRSQSAAAGLSPARHSWGEQDLTRCHCTQR